MEGSAEGYPRYWSWAAAFEKASGRLHACAHPILAMLFINLLLTVIVVSKGALYSIQRVLLANSRA